jgi:hypothetical protein
MKVKLLRDEIVITTKGPERLAKGDVRDVPDTVYASLVGRGIGVGVSAPTKPKLVDIPATEWDPRQGAGDPITDEERIGYGEFSVTKLKAMAKEAGIKGYSSMRKNELINAVLMEIHYG